MNNRIFQLLLLALLTLHPTWGAAIPEFINRYKDNRDVIFNTPEYDSTAKVYFLYGISDLDDSQLLKKKIKHLASTTRKIEHYGADLIIYQRFSKPSTADNDTPHNYDFLKRQIKKYDTRCFLVNPYEQATNSTLFKGCTASLIGGCLDDLGVLDSNGNFIASYLLEDGGITFQNVLTDKKSRIKITGDPALWACTVIMSTYKKMITDRQYVPASSKATGKMRMWNELMRVLRRKHQNNLHSRDKEEKTKNPRWLPWKQVKSDS